MSQFKIILKIITAGLIWSLALSPATFAKTVKLGKESHTENQVEEAKQKQIEEKRKNILNEATNAINETRNALIKLDKNKPKEALVSLESAMGKIGIILAKDPEMELAPAAVRASTRDVVSSVIVINEIRDEAIKALKNGRMQKARQLIGDLASETVIRVTSIPLASYQDAIELATKFIDEDEIDSAKDVLQMALNTLVFTETIIPLPIVAANHFFQEAEILAAKPQRSQEETKLLVSYLEEAREELKFAEALGYGNNKDFKFLYKQLDQIEEKIKEGKADKSYFAKVKIYLKNIAKSIQPKTQYISNK